MNDPRIKNKCGENSMPLDVKQMAYRGFKIVIEA